MAHFIDLKDMLTLIPHWLPGHLFWAYFTDCAFVAAGIAVLIGFLLRRYIRKGSLFQGNVVDALGF